MSFFWNFRPGACRAGTTWYIGYTLHKEVRSTFLPSLACESVLMFQWEQDSRPWWYCSCAWINDMAHTAQKDAKKTGFPSEVSQSNTLHVVTYKRKHVLWKTNYRIWLTEITQKSQNHAKQSRCVMVEQALKKQVVEKEVAARLQTYTCTDIFYSCWSCETSTC